MRGKLKRTINVEASIEDEHEILCVDGVKGILNGIQKLKEPFFHAF